MLVSDVLSLYTQNAPVTICELWSHDYTSYDSADEVPDSIRDKCVAHIGSYAYDQRDVDGHRSLIGIQLWIDTGHPKPCDRCVFTEVD